MLLDVSSLYQGTASLLPFSFSFSPNDASEEAEDGENLIPLLFPDVEFPEPVQVSGSVSTSGEYPVLEETAVVTYDTVCARCAEPIHGTFSVTVEKPVADEKGRYSLQNKDNDDYLQIKGGKLDLETPVRDEILLSFPSRFLCREDCLGLCAGCGANLNREVCRCQKKTVDPRFSKLAALLDTMPDDEETEQKP